MRLKAEKEREERDRREPQSSEKPLVQDVGLMKARKEQMMQKMSERLADRKGPRLKLEPTIKAKA